LVRVVVEASCYRPAQLLPPSTSKHTPVTYFASSDARCVVSESDGASSILNRQEEDALWEAFLTAAPARRRVFEPSSKRRKRAPGPLPLDSLPAVPESFGRTGFRHIGRRLEFQTSAFFLCCRVTGRIGGWLGDAVNRANRSPELSQLSANRNFCNGWFALISGRQEPHLPLMVQIHFGMTGKLSLRRCRNRHGLADQ
jgi:hypothetical protein